MFDIFSHAGDGYREYPNPVYAESDFLDVPEIGQASQEGVSLLINKPCGDSLVSD